MKILSVENLSRSFGGIKANDNISFNVEQGSILGIIGPNGAGKSTLFDLITGYTKADSGKVEFFEKNIFGLSPDKISNLGFRTTVTVEEGIDEVTEALKVTDFQNKYTNARYY